MKLSTPIFILKQQAKALSRAQGIPLHQALSRIARREGFNNWSLLAARANAAKTGTSLLTQLSAGELVLLGARPGQGKTLLGLRLALDRAKRGIPAILFTLDSSAAGLSACFRKIGQDPDRQSEHFQVDYSDRICADYIAERLQQASPNTLVIIDYLQLLDQNRCNPGLMEQVNRLKMLATERQLIIVCLSQIDRRFDDSNRDCPGLDDIRLPNPVNLALFNKACFLHAGHMRVIPNRAGPETRPEYG